MQIYLRISINKCDNVCGACRAPLFHEITNIQLSATISRSNERQQMRVRECVFDEITVDLRGNDLRVISSNAIILESPWRVSCEIIRKKILARFGREIYDNVGELSIPVTRTGIGWQKNEGTSRGDGVKKKRERRGARGKTRTEEVQARS